MKNSAVFYFCFGGFVLFLFCFGGLSARDAGALKGDDLAHVVDAIRPCGEDLVHLCRRRHGDEDALGGVDINHGAGLGDELPHVGMQGVNFQGQVAEDDLV